MTSANAGRFRSFELHLRAANRSDNTIESYLESIRQAEVYLTAHGRTLLDVRRADLEGFIADLLARLPPPPAAIRRCASSTAGLRRRARSPPAQWRR
jgi:site-specific recombinase XerD